MDEKTTEALLAKLDAIIKLMVLGMAEGKSQMEQIRLLSTAGLPPKDIATTLGTTPNTVSVALSQLRRKQKRERGGKENMQT